MTDKELCRIQTIYYLNRIDDERFLRVIYGMVVAFFRKDKQVSD